MRRYLARQFARPTGLVGRWLIGPWLDRIGRPMSRIAIAELQVAPGERILEVGFGGGELSKLILDRGGIVVGIDASPAMVARAKCRFRAAAGRACFRVGLAEALPLEDASVDKACSVNTLYFWPDLLVVMREFRRVLRPGGVLVLCFQTPQAVRSWPGHRHGFIAYPVDQVRETMEAAGFRNVSAVEGSGGSVGQFVCMKGERQ